MAEYRTIRMAFWTDPYIEELEPEAKLLYMYLFSSPHTNNLGIIEATRRKISYETGISVSNVNKYLSKFAKSGKVVIDEDHNALLLTRFIKHQSATSPKVVAGLKKLIPSIPSKQFADTLFALYPTVFNGCEYRIDTISIRYQSDDDTVSIPSAEKEREMEMEREDEYYLCAEQAHAQQSAPAVIGFPLNTGEIHNITEADIDHWQEIYPGVEILTELRRMLGWLETHPRQRKTRSGIGKFVNGWLDKAQNRSRPQGASPEAQSRKSWAELDEERSRAEFLRMTGGANG